MRISTRALVYAMTLMVPAAPLRAQAPAAPAQAPSPPQTPAASGQAQNAPVPVQLQIVIARYQGTKRVASLPYVVSLSGRQAPSPGGAARLRMNGSVPVPTTTSGPGGDGKTSPFTTYNYREVGTNIDVTAIPSVEGRLGFNVTVTDSSVYGEGDVKALSVAAGMPMFRSFNASSAVYLKDGETAEFTAASDRLTGEVTKVEVTLTVLK